MLIRYRPNQECPSTCQSTTALVVIDSRNYSAATIFAIAPLTFQLGGKSVDGLHGRPLAYRNHWDFQSPNSPSRGDGRAGRRLTIYSSRNLRLKVRLIRGDRQRTQPPPLAQPLGLDSAARLAEDLPDEQHSLLELVRSGDQPSKLNRGNPGNPCSMD